MSWGSGCTPYVTSIAETFVTRYGNWTGTGFLQYGDGTQVKGKYKYQSITLVSWIITGMSQSAAAAYTPSATAQGDIVQNVQKRRVDRSGQWHVTWDNATLGAWTDGRYPGDTDIPTEVE